MGASTSYRVFDDKLGKAKIEELWKSLVEQSLHDDGHSYSGEIGMLGTRIGQWYDKQFTKRNDVYDFIDENHEKWRPAMAVSCVENGKKLWIIGGWCAS